MSLLLGWPFCDASTPALGFGRSEPESTTNEPVSDPSGEGHWLCVAPTGSGKSASFAIPQLLSYPGSIIAVDIKGELATVTARHRRTIGEVLIFDPFALVSDGTAGFNPLSHLKKSDESLVDDAYSLASVFRTRGLRGDPFWEEWGQDVIAALITAAVCQRETKKRTLATAYDLMHSKDHVYELAVMLDKKGGAKPHPFTESKLGAFLQLPDVTRGGVSATACQQMRLLGSEAVRQSIAQNTFDLDALTHGAPVTVYLVLPPDRLASHAGLIRIVLSALLQRLLRRRHRPAQPTLLLVDEAAQIGTIPALTTAVTLGRGLWASVSPCWCKA